MAVARFAFKFETKPPYGSVGAVFREGRPGSPVISVGSTASRYKVRPDHIL